MKVLRQHIVPATYLRKFCFENNGKKVLCAFNKQSQLIQCVPPEKICKLKEFYESKNEEQTLEKTFRCFEDEYNTLYNEVIKGLDSLTNQTKEKISQFIALQMLRTESHKLDWFEISKSLLETDGHHMAPKLKKDIEEFAIPENVRKTNKEFVMKNFYKFSQVLLEKKWILVANKTRKPFWTSDNPVTFYNPDKSGSMGLISPLIQIYFPLSPKYYLLICDPESYKKYGSKLYANDENVKFQRCLQVDYSNRFIISRDKEFLQARMRNKEIPETMKLNRSAIKRVT